MILALFVSLLHFPFDSRHIYLQLKTFMLFHGFESGAVLAALFYRAERPVTSWFQLAIAEEYESSPGVDFHLLPTVSDGSVVAEETLESWMPSIPATLGDQGRRLAYAFGAHSIGSFSVCIQESRAILSRKWALSRIDTALVLLLKADAQFLSGDAIAVIQTLKKAYEAARHYSIAPEIRLQLWILIAETLLLMDLPSLAEEVLEANILTISVPDGPLLQCAWGLLDFAKKHSRRDLTVRSGLGCAPGELLPTCQLPIGGAVGVRLKRLSMIDPLTESAKVLLQELCATCSQPGAILQYTELLNKALPLAVQRTLYVEASQLANPPHALDVVSLHYLYNHILDTPDKRLAHIIWMQSDDAGPQIDDQDTIAGGVEHDIIEMLDAATRQESMLRDDYAQLTRRIDALLAKSREIESLRADISAPIARIEGDITKLIEFSAERTDGIEARAQLQRTTEAIQRDIEDLLVRINRRSSRR